MRQPKAFVSPYAKADVRKRAAAAIADGLLVATCVVLFTTQDSILFIAVGAVYLLLRDALFIPGQSVGKFLFGLRVISLDHGRPCSRLQSAQRNVILLVPGLNVVAAGLETLARHARSAGTAARRYAREHAGDRRLRRQGVRDVVSAGVTRGSDSKAARKAAGRGEVMMANGRQHEKIPTVSVPRAPVAIGCLHRRAGGRV